MSDKTAKAAPYKIGLWHHIVIWISILITALVIIGILFGGNTPFWGTDKTLRNTLLGVWALALPGFYTIEALWFSPDDPNQLIKFKEDQNKAYQTITYIFSILLAFIGIGLKPL